VSVAASAPVAPNLAEQKLALAHQALMRTRGLQFDFHRIPVPKPPAWLEPLLRVLTALGPLFQILFWIALAAGVALVIWFIAREVYDSRGPGRRERPHLVDWRPEETAARALLEEADALAKSGRFDEALHLLLFRSIDDLTGRRPGVVRPALTARDIGALEVIPPAPREAFGRIAAAVERSFFGGRRAGEGEFQQARRDYELYAFAEGWA
jgi:hypothetical protein